MYNKIVALYLAVAVLASVFVFSSSTKIRIRFRRDSLEKLSQKKELQSGKKASISKPQNKENQIRENLLTEILPLENDAWTFQINNQRQDINKCVRTFYNSLKEIDFLKLSSNDSELAQRYVINFLRELFNEQREIVQECEKRDLYRRFWEKHNRDKNVKIIKQCHLNEIRKLFEYAVKLERQQEFTVKDLVSEIVGFKEKGIFQIIREVKPINN